MNYLARLNLHTRISLVLTGLAASLLLVLAGIWLQGARTGLHEEVEGAGRGAEPWPSGRTCLFYTSGAAGGGSREDLGGGRILKKKKNEDSEVREVHIKNDRKREVRTR